jgi:hypothetical protein
MRSGCFGMLLDAKGCFHPLDTCRSVLRSRQIARNAMTTENAIIKQRRVRRGSPVRLSARWPGSCLARSRRPQPLATLQLFPRRPRLPICSWQFSISTSAPRPRCRCPPANALRVDSGRFTPPQIFEAALPRTPPLALPGSSSARPANRPKRGVSLAQPRSPPKRRTTNTTSYERRTTNHEPQTTNHKPQTSHQIPPNPAFGAN